MNTSPPYVQMAKPGNQSTGMTDKDLDRSTKVQKTQKKNQSIIRVAVPEWVRTRQGRNKLEPYYRYISCIGQV